MNSLYHTRGFWRGLARQPAWHVREWWRNPAYRALHRFHGELSAIPRFTKAEVKFLRRPIMVCDAPSFLSAWDEIFVNRIYEISQRSGDVPCLVDAGANIGLAALYWKWRYGGLNYLGFEPDPTIAECCRTNLQAWGVYGQVIEAAVAGVDGNASFVPDGADGGRLKSKVATGARSYTVPTRRLSQCLPSRIDLLKIDVEGAEAEVLRDILPCLDRIGALFVEWHVETGRGGLGDAIASLESAGFDCFVQVAYGPDQPLLAKPANGFSQQLNLFATRP